MAPSNDETFLGRWSRRKQEASREQQDERPLSAENATGPQASPADPSLPADGKMTAQSSLECDVLGAGHLTELEKVDIATLDFSSDYTPFMRQGVPTDVQSAALRKLWASDPVFSTLDGLDDCCADFSDAAWAEPGIKTAYRIGRGFLTDTEVEEWANLGKPQQVAATAERKGDSIAGTETATATSDLAEGAPKELHSDAAVDSGGGTIADARPTASTGEQPGDETAGSAAGGNDKA